MASKVLHGTGKPSILLNGWVQGSFSYEHEKIGEFTCKLAGIAKPEDFFTDYLLNRAFIVGVWEGWLNIGDLWGKIVSYNLTEQTITVDSWRGGIPENGILPRSEIGGKVIDLPYCQSLIETFTPDYLEPKKLFNGNIIKKNRGYYYSAALDYSAYSDASLLNKLQDLFDTERTDSFIFYPRRDNIAINYLCELDEDSELTWAHHKKHQGHKYISINLKSVERLSKIDLSSTNDMPIIDEDISDPPSTFNRITQGMIDSWNTAVAHIYDLIKHITAEERANWNEAFIKRHEHSNKEVIDLITAENTNNWNAHLADKSNPHTVDKTQIGLGNVSNDPQVKRDEMGQPNGVATLAADGKIPTSQLNPIAINDTFVVNSESAQVTLNAQTGDVCVRTDLNTTFINNGGLSGTISDWTELISPGKVVSVNGKAGAVTLSYSDVGASASNHNHTLASLSEKSYNSLTDKPSSFIPVPHSHTGSEITSAVTDSQRLGGNLPVYYATAAHSHTVKVSHTFAIGGEIKIPFGDDDFIPPFFIASPGSLIAARYKINSGTSVTLKIQKNGTDVLTGLSVTKTAATNDFADIATVAGDQIGIVVTAVSGTPKNLSFTIYVSYSI